MSNVTGTVFDSQPSTSTIIWIVCDSFLKPKKRQSVTLKALDIQVNITEIQGKHRVAMGVAGPYMPIFQPDVAPDVDAVRQSAWLRFHCRRRTRAWGVVGAGVATVSVCLVPVRSVRSIVVCSGNLTSGRRQNSPARMYRQRMTISKMPARQN